MAATATATTNGAGSMDITEAWQASLAHFASTSTLNPVSSGRSLSSSSSSSAAAAAAFEGIPQGLIRVVQAKRIFRQGLLSGRTHGSEVHANRSGASSSSSTPASAAAAHLQDALRVVHEYLSPREVDRFVSDTITERLETSLPSILRRCERDGGKVRAWVEELRTEYDDILFRLPGHEATLHEIFTAQLLQCFPRIPRALRQIKRYICRVLVRTPTSAVVRFKENLWRIGLGDVTCICVEEAAREAVRSRVRECLGIETKTSSSDVGLADRNTGESDTLGNTDEDEEMNSMEGYEEDLPFESDREVRSYLQNFVQEDLFLAYEYWTSSTVNKTLEDQEQWKSRFVFYLDTLITEARSLQLFDLIVGWPASTPAITDLKHALEVTGVRLDVSTALTRSLDKRLLHPGARTRDILQIYVSLVYTIRFIDPSGIILSRIAGPIRRYLRSRPDTVPVIVASLLGDEEEGFDQLRGELDSAGKSEEANNAADTSVAGGGERDDEEEEERVLSSTNPLTAASLKIVDYADPKYEPRPIDAGPSFRQTRSADVIAMLVSIFHDKASFVKALEISTARSLLKKQRAYDIAKEYRNNEVLKRRFGDSSLARCDIMLQDIIDSRRLEGGVKSLLATPLDQHPSPTKRRLTRKAETGGEGENQASASALSSSASAASAAALRALKPVIVSRHFWPDLEGTEVPTSTTAFGSALGGGGGGGSSGGGGGSKPATLSSVGPPPGGVDLKLPHPLRQALESYNAAFASLRDSRRLRWLAGYGHMLISVSLRDGRQWEEWVNPFAASILFVASSGPGSATVDDPLSKRQVAEIMGVPEGSRELEEAFAHWVTTNVLVQVEGRAGFYVEAVVVVAPPPPPPPAAAA